VRFVKVGEWVRKDGSCVFFLLKRKTEFFGPGFVPGNTRRKIDAHDSRFRDARPRTLRPRVMTRAVSYDREEKESGTTKLNDVLAADQAALGSQGFISEVLA